MEGSASISSKDASPQFCFCFTLIHWSYILCSPQRIAAVFPLFRGKKTESPHFSLGRFSPLCSPASAPWSSRPGDAPDPVCLQVNILEAIPSLLVDGHGKISVASATEEEKTLGCLELGVFDWKERASLLLGGLKTGTQWGVLRRWNLLLVHVVE